MFKLVLCLLPVLGLVVAFCIASRLHGSAQRMACAVGPFLVGCAMYWAGGEIPSRPGDHLTALGIGFVYVCGYLIIAVYYAVFLFLVIAGWQRRNAQARKAATPSTGSAAAPAQPGGSRTSGLHQPS